MKIGFDKYLNTLRETGEKMDIKQVERVIKILNGIKGKKNRIFIAGNGGSAATGAHLACDLNKTVGPGKFRAINLTDNVPAVTAIGNDEDYKEIFSRQLESLGEKGDLLLVISASGNSPNILRALETAKKMKIKSAAFLGFDGGKAKKMADEYVLIPIKHYGVAEDWHLILGHIITEYFK